MHRFQVVAASAAVVLAACGRGTPPPPPDGGWPIPIERLESPAGPASAQPQLTASLRGIVLSWLENAGSDTRLRFAERTPIGWTEARTVASGSDFFANYADLPSVRRTANGELVAHWLRRNSPQTSGYDIMIARSADGGRTWSPPFSPHHDGTKTQHGFASFFEQPGAGEPFGIVWLDGRLTTPSKDPDDDAVGEMTLRSARFDAAWQERAEQPIDLRVCDCCPTAAAATANGVVVAYRDRTTDEIRDIAVARFAGGAWSEPTTVHHDGWKIDGCPVNGPAVAANGRDVAVAWFSAPQDEGHAFVAFSRDEGRTFSAPVRVDEAGALGRVDVADAPDGSVVVSWIELADRKAAFKVRRVTREGGRSPAVVVADVSGNRNTAYPRIAVHDRDVVFAWTGTDDGLRVQTATARLP
jgi:BNR repeat-like domain